MPSPPPTLKNSMPYSRFNARATGATFATARANGPASVICEPMCI